MGNEIMSGAAEYPPDYAYNFAFDFAPFAYEQSLSAI